MPLSDKCFHAGIYNHKVAIAFNRICSYFFDRAENIAVKEAPNGELCFYEYNRYSNYFSSNQPNLKKSLMSKLSNLITIYMGKCGIFRVDSYNTINEKKSLPNKVVLEKRFSRGHYPGSDIFGPGDEENAEDIAVPVKTLWCAFDIAFNKRNKSKLVEFYSEQLVNEVTGSPRDPFLSNAIQLKMEEEKKLYDSCCETQHWGGQVFVKEKEEYYRNALKEINKNFSFAV